MFFDFTLPKNYFKTAVLRRFFFEYEHIWFILKKFRKHA